MFYKILLSLLFFACVEVLQAQDYEGYKIYDVNAKSFVEKQALLSLSNNPSYDFFLMPRALGVPARVMIPPQDQLQFENILNMNGISFRIINDNVGESVQMERFQNNYQRSSAPHSWYISFNSFQRFDNITNYLKVLAKNYKERVRLKRVGKSFEGRDMYSITITYGFGSVKKKAIFIDAGIHAREWIAPAAALFVIFQLVENYEANKELLLDYDWVILPVVNPDGYEYTHTTSRMWRKTRKPVTSRCYGTDGNRNFDFHWGEVGASSLSCSDIFKGEKAFSEPETRIVRDMMNELKGRAKFYLTLHAFGNYLLYPWGYTSALPKTWQEMDDVAKAGANAIYAVTGTKYTVGSSTNVLYAAAGGSDDYAYGKAKIPICITMELPPGGSGFDPSPQQIRPFVEETWIGIRAMAEEVMKKFL